jgi:hypothetical protein
MNIKRTSIFAGAIGGFAIVGSAVAGMNGISYDLHGMDLIAGTYTVRVYAELDAGNRLDAVNVYGSVMTLDYLDGASAYQNGYGGPTSKDVNSAFFTAFPSLEWDSYVTIGALYSDGTPFDENKLQNSGIDWTTWDPGGVDLFCDNGTFFVTPVDPQGEEQGGRVLIAQFTTFSGSGAYDINFSAGFQGKDDAGVTWQSGHSVLIPAPGAVALLGLAGLAGRRRRRA